MGTLPHLNSEGGVLEMDNMKIKSFEYNIDN